MWLLWCGLWIAGGSVTSVLAVRPSNALEGATSTATRHLAREGDIQGRQRHTNSSDSNSSDSTPGGNTSMPSDSEEDKLAVAMMAACSPHSDTKIAMKDIRSCVQQLHSYAQATRNGFIESIEAEKVFVREYKKAAKKLAFMGNTELFWQDIQKEHHNALTFLLGEASESASDASDLKAFSKLVTKKKKSPKEGLEDEDGEDEDDEDEERGKSGEGQNATGGTSSKEGNATES
mmetsp:Transcript_12637/g.23793  ORF Transcript_12637/g.23793 Transcript_12637/m.23793 type:complete len:233 (+) Transcript_12637:45-743(+)